ncbi:amino acid ABC transporter substrate-binding protein [Aquabacterium sp.]|uniref:amino acid ABC transporter substrate-binding protein n=1 Tax=Aquabacterium sp. TaxID=1872578 RepID=UPI002BB989A1|nr:amino acid ABC transporter substrate-binding protein [Aquabacterium sp.]HSW08863.1 amino acid ABC transporter substrate-binding protein [Aquabacterium sp.]
MPVIRLPLVTACLLACATTPAWSGAVLDRIKSKATLVIAHREASVPFSYLDGHKKPVGFAVELCQRVAEAVKKKLALPALKLDYVMVTTADRLAAITEGRADLECSSTTNTAERRQQVSFTVPHYITGTRYMVRADSPVQLLAEFQGKKLASTKTTAPLKAIDKANRDLLLGITIVEAPEHVKAVEMVEKGEVDGFAMDDVLLYGLMSGRPEPAKLKVVGKFLTIEPLAIMLSKDDAEFKRIVDDEMKRLIRGGDAGKLYERWFQQPIPPKSTALNLPMNYLLRDFWKYPTDIVPQ